MAKNPYFDEEGNESESTTRPGKSALPDWAQITADISDDSDDDTFEAAKPVEPPTPPVREKPSRPAKPPVAPSSVPVPQPTTVPTAVPTAVPVSQPAPAQTVVPQPAVQQAPVQPAAAPAAPAEQRKPDRSTRKPRTPRAVPEPILNTVRPEPEVAPETTKRSGRNMGGRWKVVALRVGVWGAILMIMISGIVSMVGPKGPSLQALTDQVSTSLGDNGFPFEEGSQMAMRFAKEFYTIDPDNSQRRDARLIEYFPGGQPLSSASITYTSDEKQVVVGGPYLAGKPELVSKEHVVFTVALLVQTPGEINSQTKQPVEPRWIYAAVPVTVDKAGNLAITGIPSVVPNPAVGDGGEPYLFTADSNIASEAKSAIERYFALWADSDSAGLEPYLQSGQSTWAARAGLNGYVKFASLSNLTVEAIPADAELPTSCTAPDFGYPCRKATATVIWSQKGGTFTQMYRMVLFNEGQYWRVLDIKGSTW